MTRSVDGQYACTCLMLMELLADGGDETTCIPGSAAAAEAAVICAPALRSIS